MQPSGRPRLEVDLVDLSVLVDTGLKGIIAFHGATERGTFTPTLVGSWLEYQRTFGSLLSTTDFPLICRRALEGGSKLLISRAGHYTDATDAGTLVGVKATGAITASANVLTLKAKSVGAWGNGLTVTVTAAANGIALQFDIKIELAGYPSFTQIIRNVKQTLTADEITTFNGQCNYVDIFTLANNITAGTVTLATGAQDVSVIVAADYIGDAAAGTGIHSFDNSVEATKIAVPAVALPLVDAALTAYVEARGDMLALIRTPVGLNGAAVLTYRHKTGAYTGVDTNSWRTLLFTGGLNVTDPRNLLAKDITELGDVAGCMSRKDNKQKEWFSFSGSKRGIISNALGVVVNFGSPGRASEADQLDVHGVNTVIKHDTFGIVSWGNSTLWQNPTLLKHANVAELTNFLLRALKPVSQIELFDPNDIETWRAVYRRVDRLMRTIQDGRGIWKYKYEGDQDIDKLEDAVINEEANIDAGQYKYRLFFSPKVAMKYVGVEAAITSSSADFKVLNEDFDF